MKIKELNPRNVKTASKFLLLLFTAATFASEKNADESTITKQPIILVHGAWQGPYVWNQTKADLEKAGYPVSVVSLPAHGDDITPAYQVTLQSYVEIVKAAINSYDEPVILVGHSLGGAIITQTAAELPGKISKLIYVAGFIPQSGKSVLDYSQMDAKSILGPSICLSEDQTQAGIDQPEVNLAKIFAQDATDKQKDFLVAYYKAEPTIPMGTPLNYDDSNYKAAGKKYYIFTKADNAISYDFQQKMAADTGITNTFSISTGHSPFISKSAELTALLKKIAKE